MTRSMPPERCAQAMKLCRRPRPSLRPFVDLIGVSTPDAFLVMPMRRKELVFPTGAMDLVLRLEGAPLRLIAGPDDAVGETVGTSVIGGARACAYIKDVSNPAPTVGAMLRQGAIELMSNVPAIEFAGRHTRIEDLWAPAALSDLMDRLRETQTLAGRLTLFEDILSARPPVHLSRPRSQP